VKLTRAIAAALAFALIASPAFARTKTSSATKPPRAGQYCAKAAMGTTAQDAKGTKLEWKADKKGKARWTKK
jgi:uncharacterized protein YdeI (BOF family)